MHYVQRSTRSYLFVSLFFLLVALAGCDQSALTEDAAEDLDSPALALEGDPEFSDAVFAEFASDSAQAVMAVQDQHEESLLAQPGVVGVGTTRMKDGAYGIVVFLEETQAQQPMPAALDGVPVVYEASGEVEAQSFTNRSRPARPGISIGNGSRGAPCVAGTLGAFVRKNGDTYVLTNTHVLARNVKAKPRRDPITQPGPRDATPRCRPSKKDAIAATTTYVRLKPNRPNRIDAGIARLKRGQRIRQQTACGYTPSRRSQRARVGLRVQKCGRTTQRTTGMVAAVNVTVKVGFRGERSRFRFVNQIAFTDLSEGGDSGSLIVTNNGAARPVALLFAGSRTTTFGTPIQPVLNHFGVTMVGR